MSFESAPFCNKALCKEIIELQKNALGKQIVSLIEGIPFEEEPIEKNIEEKEIKDFLSSYEKNDSQKYDFVLATSNPHKVEELQKLIRLKFVEILSLDDVRFSVDRKSVV